MKKIICTIIAFIMLLITLSGCSNPNISGETTTAVLAETTDSSKTESAAPETTVDPAAADDLGGISFPGSTLNVLSRKSTSYEIFDEEGDGNAVSNAIHSRSAELESRFGIKINVYALDGDWSQREGFISAVQTAFLSHSYDYDMIMTHSSYIVNLALSGYAYDMGSVDVIDFDKKWWCQRYMDGATINGKSYVAIGDLGHTTYEYMECVFFNKNITAKYQLPDLYDMVAEGEWTFEKMREYALLVSEDINSDGVFDAQDRYGLALNTHSCRLTTTFWDANLVVKDDNGRWVVADSFEKVIGIYDELYDLVKGHKQNVHYSTNGSKDQVLLFANDQLMLFAERLGDAELMRDMESEYGIIPFPKYNTEQENYISGTRDFVSAYLIMNDVKDPEMVGTAMEALCMLGYQKVVPAYYEATLKFKYLKDPSAMRMLDLIRNTMSFEFGCTYSQLLNNMFSTISNNLEKDVTSIASTLKKNKKTWQIKIDELYDSVDKIDN